MPKKLKKHLPEKSLKQLPKRSLKKSPRKTLKQPSKTLIFFTSLFLFLSVSIFFTTFIWFPKFALATDQGPNFPSSVVNDTSIGDTSWDNPGNATTSNNSYASITHLTSGDVTNYLKATNFGFSIPT